MHRYRALDQGDIADAGRRILGRRILGKRPKRRAKAKHGQSSDANGEPSVAADTRSSDHFRSPDAGNASKRPLSGKRPGIVNIPAADSAPEPINPRQKDISNKEL